MFAKFMADFLFSFLFGTLPQAKAPTGEAMPMTGKLLYKTINVMDEDDLTASESLPTKN